MSNSWLELYRGDGVAHDGKIQPIDKLKDDAAFYRASPALRRAVNVALALEQPLLLTGKPGTGKSELARSLAWELKLPFYPFHAKTTSAARDLFYRYDALAHFHAANFGKNEGEEPDARAFITAEALGRAILRTGPKKPSKDGRTLIDADKASVEAYLPKEDRGEEPGRSVVLIDEIDKTSRDFPNDLLNEVEHARFQIQETGDEFIADRALRPILIITSNSEKSLPDPFLRRCLFHHISPPTAEMLREIVKVRLGVGESELLDHAITWFVANRESFKKEPSTGEFLHWARVLHNLQIDPANLKAGESEILAVSYAALAKNEDDVLKLIPQKKL